MSNSRVRAAVFPVAGRGTRFLPVTKNVPKEVLPIVDRPCIEYIVAEAVAAGIEQVVFVTAEGKDALVDYFRPSPDLEAYLEATGKPDLLNRVREVVRLAEVFEVRQDEALGLGHAVLQAKPAVGDQDFAVLLGDDIIDSERPAIAQLMDERVAGQAVVALMEVPYEETQRVRCVRRRDAQPETNGRLGHGRETCPRKRPQPICHRRSVCPSSRYLGTPRGNPAWTWRRDPAHRCHREPRE